MTSQHPLDFGAVPLAGGDTHFRVWAPRASSLAVRICGEQERSVDLVRGADDIFEGRVYGVGPGADYAYLIDGSLQRPDPVSRSQPRGVHGPSRVVDTQAFNWSDAQWRGRCLEDYLVYELHVGTFSAEGTFAAVIPKLPYLRDLGVTAVEIMPVAEFPGGRNWGYDGVHLYAPQSTYGGPDGLQQLVDACHRHGLAMILDVVYNHLGPEGNYLAAFAPYFCDRYRTPWGDAVNFDGPDADGVRRFFIDNALYWLTEYHVDALRLDAIHGIFDFSARHILEELQTAFHERARILGRQAHIIAESDLSDVRIINPVDRGGYGIDAQWNDDFHHAARTLLTQDRHGYFVDFGRVEDLAKAVTQGFVYDGRRSSYRRRRHGSSSALRPGQQFVVCTQNHDQIANSSQGLRLSLLVNLEQQKLAAALLMTAPNIPMLFMGQEYGEISRFHYFVSHGDPQLVEAVRAGRKKEFEAFGGGEEFATPQSEETFLASKLDWRRIESPGHAAMLALHRDLIALRQRHPCLSNCRKDLTRVWFDEDQRWLVIERGDPDGMSALVFCNFSNQGVTVTAPRSDGVFERALSTNEARFGGTTDGRVPPKTVDMRAGQQIAVTLPEWSAHLYLRRIDT